MCWCLRGEAPLGAGFGRAIEDVAAALPTPFERRKAWRDRWTAGSAKTRCEVFRWTRSNGCSRRCSRSRACPGRAAAATSHTLAAAVVAYQESLDRAETEPRPRMARKWRKPSMVTSGGRPDQPGDQLPMCLNVDRAASPPCAPDRGGGATAIVGAPVETRRAHAGMRRGNSRQDLNRKIKGRRSRYPGTGVPKLSPIPCFFQWRS